MARLSGNWRRKIGFVMLLLALLLAAVWERAQFVDDAEEVTIPVSGSVKYIVRLSPSSFRVFRRAESRNEHLSTVQMQRLIEASYWSVMMPLLAVSAYLLLKKPRTSERLL